MVPIHCPNCLLPFAAGELYGWGLQAGPGGGWYGAGPEVPLVSAPETALEPLWPWF